MLFLTIIIATCDRPDLLGESLKSIQGAIVAMDGAAVVEIVVVDNGIDRTACDAYHDFSARTELALQYLTSAPDNKPVALNLGIDGADAEWLAFTDDDTLPDKNWLVEAEMYIRAHPDVKVFGGRIVPGDADEILPSWLKSPEAMNLLRGPAVVSYEPYTEKGLLTEKSQVPLGANIFVHKSIFEKYGAYDEKLWKRCGKSALGCEDAEFAMRVRNAGEKIGYCADAVVVHPVAAERATVRHHIKWSYYSGVREKILFPDHKVSCLYLCKCIAGGVLRSLRALILFRQTELVKAMMDVAFAVGEMFHTERAQRSEG